MSALAQKATAIGCWPAAEADWLRPISQVIKPVPPVTRETLRCAIGCILLQEHGKRTKRILTARQLVHQRGVNIRHPPLEEHDAKAVDQNMMVTLVPKEPSRRRLEQREKKSGPRKRSTGLAKSAFIHPSAAACGSNSALTSTRGIDISDGGPMTWRGPSISSMKRTCKASVSTRACVTAALNKLGSTGPWISID